MLPNNSMCTCVNVSENVNIQCNLDIFLRVTISVYLHAYIVSEALEVNFT